MHYLATQFEFGRAATRTKPVWNRNPGNSGPLIGEKGNVDKNHACWD